MNKSIRIDDQTITAYRSHPISYTGKHSGKALAGIDLRINLTEGTDTEILEGLVQKGTVSVEDPHAGRSYEATIYKRKESFQVGRPEHDYHIELREVDLPPRFETLEIDGKEFAIIDYRETDPAADAIGRYALLRLNEIQFRDLRTLLRPGPVSVRRVGVDAEPMSLRFGGAMYWSKHEEAGATYYKHIVRFFPVELPSSTLPIAPAQTTDALVSMTTALAVRLEALIIHLTERGQLDTAMRDKLLAEEWGQLLKEARVDQIACELERVEDAERHI